jgi:uncharacterized protein with HEPN domain
MMETDLIYLLHIRDAIQRVLAYTREGRDAFLADAKTQDAVVRNLEIIGQSAKRLPDATTGRCPDVPWQRIAGLRDALIDDYFGVKLEAAWNVVESDLAPLSSAVQHLLAENVPDDEDVPG